MGATASAIPRPKKHQLDFDYDVFSKCARFLSASDLNRGTVIELTPPLLLEIASFLGNSVQDHVRFCNMTSSFLSSQIQPFSSALWSQLYRLKWQPMHEYMEFRGVENWHTMYRETYMGKADCVLEVFDREKKPGFAMAAMAANIHYERSVNAYVAKYISASEVMPEVISVNETHRLRFCPVSARSRLQPGLAPPWSKEPSAAYPYKVLEDTDGLVVGQGVELQWKMQLRSPFGWWFGNLEALNKEPDGKLYSATITFRHFPSTSRWYRLVVRFGDAEMRPCSFGGYTGGVRGVDKTEQARWLAYLPKVPVDL